MALDGLATAYRTGLPGLLPLAVDKPLTVMGLQFANRVGLAAGMDKNGDYIDALAALGFGFVEVGTATPKPQPGNPKPRLFRLPQQLAIINRMGFNSRGIDYLLRQLARCNYRGIVGVNIGKNAATPTADAVDDYLIGLRKSYLVASYITINISSPNTANLRNLQQSDTLQKLLGTLKEEQLKLQQIHNKYTPLVLKISPDLTDEQIVSIAKACTKFAIDGVICGNTTTSRAGVAGFKHSQESGGLSGKPLHKLSTQLVAKISAELRGAIPIIASGGILTGSDAQDKINAGASLVQIYSGLIYQGPAMVAKIVRALDCNPTTAK